MAKSLDLGSPTPGKKQQATKEAANTTKREAGALVDLNFKVSAEFRREFKLWAAAHDLSQKAALEKAFQLLKNSHI
jgi:hypothetical protein